MTTHDMGTRVPFYFDHLTEFAKARTHFVERAIASGGRPIFVLKAELYDRARGTTQIKILSAATEWFMPLMARKTAVLDDLQLALVKGWLDWRYRQDIN